MMMRWTKQFIPTLREVPQEAEIASHKLMLRAGLIRKLGAGLYSFLPLGMRSLRRVENIVREEMDRAGALEVLMPALQPREIWERSGRYEVLKHVMFAMKDRQDRPMVLGPTHEEIITDIVAHDINSYRQLPRNFYQIQTKFRDEIRPRFGLMRAKEFIMKDAYSFDVSSEDADVSYEAMYNAYVRIFKRCGLQTKVVEADTGAMGGKSSHEFMVLTDAGEDGIVECDACSYAANLERAEGRRRFAAEYENADKMPEEISTPNQWTAEDISKLFKAPATRVIKTLIYVADEKPVAVMVSGDRDVNEIKLKRALGAKEVVLADTETVEKVTGAKTGYAGPVGLSIPVYADVMLQNFRGAITGANKTDKHFVNVDLNRDAKVVSYVDVSFSKEGDGCPRCEGTLRQKRGVEVGHVFKLGTKYSEALGAKFLATDGQQKPAIMGCYGIGVSRTLQAVIEQTLDANGIIWPISIAPYEVEVLTINAQHPESVAIAETLIAELEKKGITVLYDDRDERPGVKFKDADLVGVPVRVSVGEKSLAKGGVELKLRRSGEMSIVPVAEAAAAIEQLVKKLYEELS